MTTPKKFDLNLRRTRLEGICVSVGCPLDATPVLRVVGYEDAGNAFSNLPMLSKYGQIEIVSPFGGPSTFIGVPGLLDNPQTLIGFHESGFPLLLGVKKAMEGHITVIGPTRCGKSTTIGAISYQVSRLGFPVFVIGLKAMDPMLLASLKAGCESKTRIDKNGNLISAPFEYFTLQPGLKTKAFNYHTQKRSPTSVKWIDTGGLLQAIMPGGTVTDASRRYFVTSAQAFLQSFDWGKSFRELKTNAENVEQDRDERYSTNGIRGEIAQIAQIDQVNRPADDPASIDLERVIRNCGGVYFDCCYQDVGAPATAVAGLIVQAIIAAKRAILPGRDKRVFIFLDEVQQFPKDYLKQLIEQAAGSGITLLLAYHTLEQMGEDAETISMTQVRMIFGAVPGASTDRHLQSLFGTHKTYRFNFSNSSGASSNESVTHSSGPAGSSVAYSNGFGTTKQSSFGFAETEEQVWTPNDTLELNNNRERFVLQVSPGAEIAHFGPRPVVGQRGGIHMPYEKINQITEDALENTPGTYLPGADNVRQIEAFKIPEGMEGQREKWLAVLNNAFQKFRISNA